MRFGIVLADGMQQVASHRKRPKLRDVKATVRNPSAFLNENAEPHFRTSKDDQCIEVVRMLNYFEEFRGELAFDVQRHSH